jgi:transcriptional regulator with XRE-family HTH domain
VAQTIGVWLQQARLQRGVSQYALAQRAHLSPSTINRWERGVTRPSIYELEQALQALGASSAERLEALRLLDAPRALMTLQQFSRQQPHPSGELNPPLLGDLLGALRRRQGWSVAQVAAALHVSERSVRGWERSQAIPSDEHLHALCYALQATPDEVAFILTRPLWLEPPSPHATQEDASLLKTRIEEMRQLVWQGATEGMELRLLALEAQVWWHVRQCPRHAEFLREVYTLCCQWYTLHGRVQDAERYGYRGLRLVSHAHSFPRSAAWFIMAIAIGNADPNRSAARLVESAGILQDWLPQVSHSVEHEAWFYREISEFYSAAHRYEEAERAAEQGFQMIQRSENPAEHQHAQVSRALVLCRVGQPSKAMETLKPPVNPLPATQAHYLMVLYEICCALGDSAQAASALTQAEQIAQQHAIRRTLQAIQRLQQANKNTHEG